eukprot:TRINITY_DN32309_c0_g1_i1.p1 TRINITY_DN32309_c0_g1~~TRINITY_DN32309_c0_g1_i1.p1  ORF type:complete len:453 (+),score=109.00 TRINITY_DN32309_c0_g1_i1:142-1359(+)
MAEGGNPLENLNSMPFGAASELAGSESSKHRAFVGEQDEFTKRMLERRREMFADESRNKLKLDYDVEDFKPEGSPQDHVMVQEHAAFVTHMVPVDHVRGLVPMRFTLDSIIHEMEEWALVTVRHERASLHPFRNAFGKQGEVDVVSYYTYVVDRCSGERIQFCFSYYTTECKFTKHMRKWWQLPVHALGGFESDIAHDGKKFTDYGIRAIGSASAKAGAVHLRLEDTGYSADKVKSFAGFADAESALVYITNTNVECYQQLDWTVGRRDVWHDRLSRTGRLTIGRMVDSSPNDGTYSGITDPQDMDAVEPVTEPPLDVYPWVQFWDLMRLNRKRRLHSVLMWHGRMETETFMPLHIYNDQTTDPTPQPKLRLLGAAMKRKIFSQERKTKMTEKDYDELWKAGKFT